MRCMLCDAEKAEDWLAERGASASGRPDKVQFMVNNIFMFLRSSASRGRGRAGGQQLECGKMAKSRDSK